jgi:hypothetical protein
MPYDLEISIWNSLKSAMLTARVVKLLRPLPPTPTNRALPLGWLMTREMREMCSIAFANSTSAIGFFVMLLNSSKYSCARFDECKRTEGQGDWVKDAV